MVTIGDDTHIQGYERAAPNNKASTAILWQCTKLFYSCILKLTGFVEFVHCPEFKITIKHNVSETGCFRLQVMRRRDALFYICSPLSLVSTIEELLGRKTSG
jgi:hypothetical protein